MQQCKGIVVPVNVEIVKVLFKLAHITVIWLFDTITR